MRYGSGLNYYERRARREANASANAAKREARAQAAMTCQVCNRPILANTGLIAHHGYERPGEGWQTASCSGARQLPFQCSRDALEREIGYAEARVLRLQADRETVQAEGRDIAWKFDDKTVRADHYGRGGETTRWVNRGNFSETLAYRNSVARYRYAGAEPTYDSLKQGELRHIEGQLETTRRYLAHQSQRYENWPGVTHTWADGAWTPVDASSQED